MLCLQLETFWAGRSDGPTCAPFAGPSTSQRRHGWRTGTWGKTSFLAIEGGRHNAGSKFLLKSESATSQRSPPVAPHARPLRRPPPGDGKGAKREAGVPVMSACALAPARAGKLL